jgi:hypothetical protein
MPPASALKRKLAISAGDASTKCVDLKEDFEQMVSSTSSETSSSSPGSPTVSCSSTSSDKSDVDCPHVAWTIWDLLEENRVSAKYLFCVLRRL